MDETTKALLLMFFESLEKDVFDGSTVNEISSKYEERLTRKIKKMINSLEER